MGGWTLWKLTAIATVLVATTAVVTGLVVAHWSGRETERAAAVAPSPPPPRAPSRPPTSPAPQRRAATAQEALANSQPPVSPEPARNREPALNARPASRVPTQETIDACNGYAAEQAGQRDKTIQVAKDALIGAVAGAAVGGVLGATGGTLYGLNEAKKQDERYRDAYALCMRARGYGG